MLMPHVGLSPLTIDSHAFQTDDPVLSVKLKSCDAVDGDASLAEESGHPIALVGASAGPNPAMKLESEGEHVEELLPIVLHDPSSGCQPRLVKKGRFATEEVLEFSHREVTWLSTQSWIVLQKRRPVFGSGWLSGRNG